MIQILRDLWRDLFGGEENREVIEDLEEGW